MRGREISVKSAQISAESTIFVEIFGGRAILRATAEIRDGQITGQDHAIRGGHMLHYPVGDELGHCRIRDVDDVEAPTAVAREVSHALDDLDLDPALAIREWLGHGRNSARHRVTRLSAAFVEP